MIAYADAGGAASSTGAAEASTVLAGASSALVFLAYRYAQMRQMHMNGNRHTAMMMAAAPPWVSFVFCGAGEGEWLAPACPLRVCVALRPRHAQA